MGAFLPQSKSTVGSWRISAKEVKSLLSKYRPTKPFSELESASITGSPWLLFILLKTELSGGEKELLSLP